MKNCVIIDIEKYDDMVNESKEYSKLSKEYDKRVFEKMELIDTIQKKDEEIERLKITIKNMTNLQAETRRWQHHHSSVNWKLYGRAFQRLKINQQLCASL